VHPCAVERWPRLAGTPLLVSLRKDGSYLSASLLLGLRRALPRHFACLARDRKPPASSKSLTYWCGAGSGGGGCVTFRAGNTLASQAESKTRFPLKRRSLARPDIGLTSRKRLRTSLDHVPPRDLLSRWFLLLRDQGPLLTILRTTNLAACQRYSLKSVIQLTERAYLAGPSLLFHSSHDRALTRQGGPRTLCAVQRW